MALMLRAGTPADAEPCGQICYEAFGTINAAHHFPPDFPDPAAAVTLLARMLAHPGFYVVVAERDGRIVGSNAMDERSMIAGIGPITVDPQRQNAGVGRQLMQHLLTRAAARRVPGVRLVQAAFHTRSLALYTSLGFAPREPLSCMQGPALHVPWPGYAVRARDAGGPRRVQSGLPARARAHARRRGARRDEPGRLHGRRARGPPDRVCHRRGVLRPCGRRDEPRPPSVDRGRTGLSRSRVPGPNAQRCPAALGSAAGSTDCPADDPDEPRAL